MASNKYDNAVKRSRGEVIEAAPEMSLATIGSEQVEAGIQALTPDTLAQLAAMAAAGEIEVAAKLLTLAEGQMITGFCKSSGEATIEDINTKEPKQVTTWQFDLIDPATRARNGVSVSILGSAQLDRMLPPYLGTERAVIVARGGEQKIKGGAKRMTEYFVAAFKAPVRGVPSRGGND